METTASEIQQVGTAASEAARPFHELRDEMHRVIVGQDDLLNKMLIGLLANGHILLEGVPGLAKTTAVACLAGGIQAAFQRLQFTPDLLPADLIGTLIYRPKEGDFVVKKGPVFSNIILADEINRAPAKVQSALLEAMQERQVTIGTETFKLDTPFLVLATQNPIEQEGTYPLPEAQVDRFMFKVIVEYPTREQELEILERMSATRPNYSVKAVMTCADIAAARDIVDRIYVDDKVKTYVVDLVHASRNPQEFNLPLADLIQFGASPRATIFLAVAAKAAAFMAGRGYVTPQDVKDIAMDVLRHRIIITYEAEAEEKKSEDIVRAILDCVPVP